MSQDGSKDIKKRRTKKPFRPNVPLLLASIAVILSLASFINSELSKNTFLNEKERLTQTHANIETLKERQKSMLSTLQEKQNDLATALNEGEKRQEEQQAQLKNISNILGRVIENSHDKDETWRLKEANYYLTLANLTLKWSYDLPASISLLEALDKTLASLNRLDLHSLRVKLHDIIAELKAIPPLDEVAILGQLQALITQSQQLKFTEPQFNQNTKEVTSKSTSAAQDSTMKEAWQKTLESLKKVVIIRHNTKPLPTLQSPDEINAITEALTLTFEQAKWAVIKRHSKLYQFSLEQALTMLERYYQPSSQLKSMQATIETLKKEALNPPLPSLNPIAQLLQRTLTQSTQPQALNNTGESS